MGVVTGLISTGVAVSEATGFKPLKAIGDLFGGGGEPNAGSKNLVDALDNYDGISTSQAQAMEQGVVNKLIEGASDYEVAAYIRQRSGNRYSASSLMSGFKWPILKGVLDQIRAQIRQQQKNQQATSTTASTASTAKNALTEYSFFIIGGIVAIAGIFYFALK